MVASQTNRRRGAPPPVPMLSLAEVEDRYIRAALRRCGGNAALAARSIGCGVRKIQVRRAWWRELDRAQKARTAEGN